MDRFLRVAFLLTIVAVVGMPAPSFPWPIPDTGQTQSYSHDVNTGAWIEGPCPQPGEALYGQDGNYLINAPSYTKLDASGNDLADSATSWAMVRDNVTGLIWEVKTDDGSIHDKDNTYNWYSAQDVFIAALNNTEFGGHSDWRFPTIAELTSIVDLGRYNPAINTAYFPNTLSSYYWSSTAYPTDTLGAWGVHFGGGVDHWDYRSSNYYVRAVRGGQSGSFGNLILNNDGTVTDTSTGLMWQQNTVNPKDWSDAVLYCETLDLSDYDDWRLPNIKELKSIVDYGSRNPNINTFYFPATVSSHYWSSTTNARSTSDAWLVRFGDSYVNWSYKSTTYYVRAVRGGQNRLMGHLFISVPKQGSAWKIGDSMGLLWEGQGIAGNVQISISRQGGIDGTFEVIEESADNDGTYNWTVTGPASANCILKIEPLDDVSKGTIQGLFSIYECPIVTSNPASFVKSDAATLNGTVNPNSLPTTVTFEWGTDKTYGNEISAAESPLIGETAQNVSGELKDLEASTTYHYRVKAVSNWCTIYGEDQNFSTNEAVIPTVITASITSTTSNSASGGGEVVSDGGVEVTSNGVCWSTLANPTISDAKTSDGTGLGIFTSSIENLTVTTTYHLRAYAINSKGAAYGNDVLFETSKLCVTCVDSKNELQAALTSAQNNGKDDIIRIIRGQYKGNFTYFATEANNLTLEGGYASGCASRVIDPGNTVLDGGGINNVLILAARGTTANFTVEGLTIQNGRSTYGGGLRARTDGHLTLTNNIFSGNSSTSTSGGGVYADSSSTLTNNNFIENVAGMGGYGLGGGAYLGSESTLIGNRFIMNSSSCGGGAYVGSNCTLAHNSFIENSSSAGGYDASGSGGGAYVGSNSELTNNIFSGNNAEGYKDAGSGGGAYVGDNSTLTNNRFTENTCSHGGGGAYIESNSTLTNDIFTENTSDNGGGASIGSNSTLTNCIVYGNSSEGSQISGYPIVTYSCIKGGYPGEGNIDADPQFFGDNDYRLKLTSPCIDAGTAAGAPDTDIEGTPRPQGSGYDMGAYEKVANPCPECAGHPVILKNVRFNSGTECECTDNESISVGPDVKIENGATILFKAPEIKIKPGVDIQPGALVNMRQE